VGPGSGAECAAPEPGDSTIPRRPGPVDYARGNGTVGFPNAPRGERLTTDHVRVTAEHDTLPRILRRVGEAWRE